MWSILQSSILIIISFFLLSSCAASYRVNLHTLVPASLSEVGNYKTVAIDELAGEYGKVITPKVKYVIDNVRIYEKKEYVIDQASNIRWQGSVNHKEELEPYTDKRTYRACAAYNSKGTCMLYIPITEKKECNNITFYLNIFMKLVDNGNEEALLEKKYSYSHTSSECKNSRAALTKRFDISNYYKSIESFLNDFRQDIAPYDETYSYDIDFWDNSENMSAEARKSLSEGISLLKKSSNNIADACVSFLHGLKYEERSPTLNYNVGACYEIGGDYEKALFHYEVANESILQINDDIIHALNRVSKLKENKEKLSKQLKVQF